MDIAMGEDNMGEQQAREILRKQGMTEAEIDATIKGCEEGRQAIREELGIED
jgi:hypothetical protein